MPRYYRELETHLRLQAEAEAAKIENDFKAHLDAEFEAASAYKSNKADWLEGTWEGLSFLNEDEEKRDELTGVDLEILKEIGHSLAREPDDINTNRKLIRQLKAKAEMTDSG